MNIKFSRKNSAISLDTAFINTFMPKANGSFVKVYLYTLMCAERGIEISNAQLSAILGIPENDIIQAFAYWHEQGAVEISDGEVIFRSLTDTADTASTEATFTEHDTSADTAANNRPDISATADALSENGELADMCNLAQEVLGKPLTSQDTSTLYWFYDELGFSPEVILTLLEYCVSKDKRNMNYIEKVAIGWHENGIRTLEQVDAYLTREASRGDYFGTIRKIMGIDRTFSKTESDFLYKWRDEYNMSEEMVALAYEYCVIQISKISFQYMDKILQRWHDSGIHTVAQAEEDNKNFKRSPSSPKQGGYQPEVFQDNFNHSELEKMVWERLGK